MVKINCTDKFAANQKQVGMLFPSGSPTHACSGALPPHGTCVRYLLMLALARRLRRQKR